MLQKLHDLTFLYFETKSEGNFFHLKRLNKCESKSKFSVIDVFKPTFVDFYQPCGHRGGGCV